MANTPGPIELTLRQRLQDAHMATAIGQAPSQLNFSSFTGDDLAEFIFTVMNATEEAVLQLAVEADSASEGHRSLGVLATRKPMASAAL